MKTQVFKENDLAPGGLVDGLLDLRADTVISENDRLSQQLFKLRNDRFQAIFGILLSVRTTEVRGKNDGFGTVVNGILDGGDSTGYSLGVCDLLVCVERDIEVNL